MEQSLLARKIPVTANIRCDFCHRTIEKGKYASQVVGDPDVVKAQGTYHGRECYEAALADYNEKKETFDMEEDVRNG